MGKEGSKAIATTVVNRVILQGIVQKVRAKVQAKANYVENLGLVTAKVRETIRRHLPRLILAVNQYRLEAKVSRESQEASMEASLKVEVKAKRKENLVMDYNLVVVSLQAMKKGISRDILGSVASAICA